jgi:hypothetical protein
MSPEPRFLPALTLMLSGFLAWAAHFGLIYSYTGLLCERPDWAAAEIGGVGIVPFGIAAITVLTLIALAGVMMRSGMMRSGAQGGEALLDERFYRQLTQGSAALGGLAIIWQGILSIAFVPACG